MIPHQFRYQAPESLADVVAALAADPEGTVLLAGGSWVVPGLGRGERQARQVVDLRRAGLAGIQFTDGTIRVGACATYADILAAPLPRVLRLMAAQVTGGPQIVGRGTVGGAAVAARPASDIPAVLTVLSAVAELVSPTGVRRVPVSELWTGPFTTSLRPGEVLAAFEFPALPAGTSCGYVKLKHGTSSWPIVTAAAIVRGDTATVAIGGACTTPIQFHVEGGHLDAHEVRAALTEVWDDELAPAAYRAALAPVAASRALAAATPEEPT